MEHSPASRILIYGIFFSLLVIMAFAFFALTGGNLKPGGTFGMKMADVLYEAAPPEGGRRVSPSLRQRDLPPAPEGLREPAVPETPAETQYYAAIQKAKIQETRHAARLKPRDDILKFLESPLGKDLRAISELARRGRTAEAREYLPKVLAALADQPPEIQAYALKMAMMIYKQEKDPAGLEDAVRQYLQLAKSRASSDRTKVSGQERQTIPEAMHEIDEMLNDLGKAHGGGGR